MIYRDFCSDNLSMLGMGCMRFPCKADGAVDMQKTAEMIDKSIKNGVNYFDTAWFYHEGKSEEIIGEILKRYDRSTYYIATKMPWTDINTADDVRKIFETQLEKTGVEYFDYYLIHNVCAETVDIFTNENLKIIDFLCDKRKEGKIRHLGFSTHADLELMEAFLERYKDVLEFCQIQLNWLDWTLQKAKEKVELLHKYNMPIWVMEPVRGGKLANLSEKDKAVLKSMRPDESIAAWSFRFLQGIDGIKMILSGMSDEEQVLDNIKTFSEEKPLSEKEKSALFGIADNILSKKILTCTNCRYCVTQCPKEIDIPKILGIYNDVHILGMERADAMSAAVSKDCISCRKCEQKCPQEIKISEIMKDCAEKF